MVTGMGIILRIKNMDFLFSQYSLQSDSSKDKFCEVACSMM